jgi:hypothetical protein
VGDGLFHDGRVDGDPLQAHNLEGTRGQPGLDRLGQQPFDTLLANPPAPVAQRGRVDGRAVLERGGGRIDPVDRSAAERRAGEVLVVGVFHPPRDDGLVRQPAGVLQVEQPRHQPRRRRRPTLVRGKEPGPLRLEERPVTFAVSRLGCSPASFTSSWRKSIMSVSRGRSRSSCSGSRGLAFIAPSEIAGFRPEPCETLHSQATPKRDSAHEIKSMGVVQGELRVGADRRQEHRQTNGHSRCALKVR